MAVPRTVTTRPAWRTGDTRANRRGPRRASASPCAAAAANSTNMLAVDAAMKWAAMPRIANPNVLWLARNPPNESEASRCIATATPDTKAASAINLAPTIAAARRGRAPRISPSRRSTISVFHVIALTTPAVIMAKPR